MRNHLIVLVACLALLAPRARAEGAESATVTSKARLPLSLSYFGEWAVLPGARLSAPFKVLTSGGHSLLVEPGLGFRHHAGHSTALFAEALVGYRYTFGFGGFGELALGAGYGRALASGTVYARAADGSMRPVADGGVPLLMGTLAPALGWDAQGAMNLPLAVFFRLRATWFGAAPSTLTLYPVTEAGLTWTFDL